MRAAGTGVESHITQQQKWEQPGLYDPLVSHLLNSTEVREEEYVTCGFKYETH